ncbi:hypothetical protein BJ085DRAFT_40092 [Dimargaris cristalligena]|uniref:Calcium-activated potassium channel BK alpha subunit domain-containing protein n=1 Tax=Dimargaris cristalligena TaxID=215637 RepID=A0A4Q0A1J2_9FUNG|nr:hypothetical protein BJ085DRAFT_40092 [Dimargaris cristalligena]|eukprot:RKP39914.1 hypothetical protein BJ085DRAFT_40092 [Dimargaris cristalligena]
MSEAVGKIKHIVGNALTRKETSPADIVGLVDLESVRAIDNPTRENTGEDFSVTRPLLNEQSSAATNSDRTYAPQGNPSDGDGKTSSSEPTQQPAANCNSSDTNGVGQLPDCDLQSPAIPPVAPNDPILIEDKKELEKPETSSFWETSKAATVFTTIDAFLLLLSMVVFISNSFVLSTDAHPREFPVARIILDLVCTIAILAFYVFYWKMRVVQVVWWTWILVMVFGISVIIGTVLYFVLPVASSQYLGVSYASTLYFLRFVLLAAALERLVGQYHAAFRLVDDAYNQVIQTMTRLFCYWMAISSLLQTVVYFVMHADENLNFSFGDTMYYVILCLINGPTDSIIEDNPASRVLVCLLIIGIFVVIPLEFQKISDVFQKRSQQERPVKHTSEKNVTDIFVCGYLTLTSVQAILNSIDESTSLRNVKKQVTFIDHQALPEEVMKLITSREYRHYVAFIKRVSFDYSFLLELNIQDLDIFLVITDYDSTIHSAEYMDSYCVSKTMRICQFLWLQNMNNSVRTQVILRSSMKYLRKFSNCQVICLDDSIVNMLASNCVAPGMATLLYQLVRDNFSSVATTFISLVFNNCNLKEIRLSLFPAKIDPSYQSYSSESIFYDFLHYGTSYKSIVGVSDTQPPPPTQDDPDRKLNYFQYKLASHKFKELFQDTSVYVNVEAFDGDSSSKSNSKTPAAFFGPSYIGEFSNPLPTITDHLIVWDFQTEFERVSIPLLKRLRGLAGESTEILYLNGASLPADVLDTISQIPKVQLIPTSLDSANNLSQISIKTARSVILLHRIHEERSEILKDSSVYMAENYIRSRRPYIPIIKRYPCNVVGTKKSIVRQFAKNYFEWVYNTWRPIIAGDAVFTDIFYYLMNSPQHIGNISQLLFPTKGSKAKWCSIPTKYFAGYDSPSATKSDRWYAAVYNKLMEKGISAIGATTHESYKTKCFNRILCLVPRTNLELGPEDQILCLIPDYLDIAKIREYLAAPDDTSANSSYSAIVPHFTELPAV